MTTTLHRPSAALAILLLPAALAPGAAAQAPEEEPSWHVGASAYRGDIPSPFGPLCPGRFDAGPQAVPVTTFSAWEMHASMARASGFDLTGRLSRLRDGDYACPAGLGEPGGTDSTRRYGGDAEGTAATAAELTVGYAPPAVPVIRGSVGGGWLLGGRVPYGVATVGLRVGMRVRLMVDAGFRYASVPYRDYESEVGDEGLVRRDTGRGRSWAWGRELRIGVDIRVR